MKKSIVYYWIGWFVLWCVGSSCSDGAGCSVVKEDSLTVERQEIALFKMVNRQGMTVRVTNYGASLVYLSAPDVRGVYEPVVLGLDSLSGYLGRQPKLGATVGRYANRIAQATLVLDGDTVFLDNNAKGHCIHGGFQGFHTRIFQTDTCYVVKDTTVVVFSYVSRHGEGGFPGNLHVSVAYKLTQDNALVLDYTAVSDKSTPVNFTNHSYFNLTGCKSSVAGHSCRIGGDSITVVDSTGVPTGELMPVSGTDYDFRALQPLAPRLAGRAKGYDVNYKLTKEPGSLAWAATVIDSVSGRVLKAYTTEPGMQFYVPAADFSYLKGQAGRVGRYSGLCLEMQHFPDSPHHPHFPTTILHPGEQYRQTTVYKFETLNQY